MIRRRPSFGRVRCSSEIPVSRRPLNARTQSYCPGYFKLSERHDNRCVGSESVLPLFSSQRRRSLAQRLSSFAQSFRAPATFKRQGGTSRGAAKEPFDEMANVICSVFLGGASPMHRRNLA